MSSRGRFGLDVAEPIGKGRAAQAKLTFLAVLDELRTIEIGEDEVVMRFDNTGDHVVRTIHMDAEHPADAQPSLHGHSIGRWDGDTLVIDTIGYESSPSGNGMNVPSSTRKHTIERLTLTADRTRLRYEMTVEDPAYLTGPGTTCRSNDPLRQ